MNDEDPEFPADDAFWPKWNEGVAGDNEEEEVTSVEGEEPENSVQSDLDSDGDSDSDDDSE